MQFSYLVHFDMETQDPDDVLALCVLATHPRVHLLSVTLHPGGRDQVGVVKHVLQRLDREDVRVGAAGLDDGKWRVSAFHYRWLGKVPPADPDGTTDEVILESLATEKPGPVALVTGAAVTNPAAALAKASNAFDIWVAQGGFAGDNIVPPEDRLPKFAGKLVCPTFNFNGDPAAAFELLGNERIPLKRLVSKNVCHGQFHDQKAQDRMPRGAHAGLDLLLNGMRVYLDRKREGKALHDVLAVALLLDEEAATWARVKMYREKSGWGAKPSEDSDTLITTRLDRLRVERALAG
jgi:inosine-uridine nucleoside N-ribohydrolase